MSLSLLNIFIYLLYRNGWVEFDSEAALNKALAQDGVVVEGQAITVGIIIA